MSEPEKQPSSYEFEPPKPVKRLMSSADYMESIRINRDMKEMKKINEGEGYIAELYQEKQKEALSEEQKKHKIEEIRKIVRSMDPEFRSKRPPQAFIDYFID